MTWIVKAIVKLKDGVLDVQGRAVEAAVKQLGLTDIQDLKIGKYIEFLAIREPDKNELQKIGDDLLRNPVIETIEFSVKKS